MQPATEFFTDVAAYVHDEVIRRRLSRKHLSDLLGMSDTTVGRRLESGAWTAPESLVLADEFGWLPPLEFLIRAANPGLRTYNGRLAPEYSAQYVGTELIVRITNMDDLPPATD